MKKSDRVTAIVIVGAAAMLLVASALLHRLQGSTASIRVDGLVVATVDLTTSTPATLEINGFVGPVDVVTDGTGSIRVAKATCPDQICVHTRPARSTGDQIICVPNRLVITIEKSDHTIDALTQ